MSLSQPYCFVTNTAKHILGQSVNLVAFNGSTKVYDLNIGTFFFCSVLEYLRVHATLQQPESQPGPRFNTSMLY